MKLHVAFGIATLWGCSGMIAAAQAINHGVPASVSESRGAVATADAQGRPIILVLTLNRPSAKGPVGTLLMIDARSGKVEEFPYPDRARGKNSSFGLMVASNGKLYTGFGPLLVEFDPNRRAFTWETQLKPDLGNALAWAEGPDGTIYVGYFNSCSVIALNPATHAVRELGQMDPKEKFVQSLYTDDAGWLYAGIGDARSNLVALHVATGERRQLVAESARAVGAGILRRGKDSGVYGRANYGAKPWLRLRNGEATPVEGEPQMQDVPAMGWQKVYPHFPDGSHMSDFDLPNTSYTLIAPDGTSKALTFSYTGPGADISTLNGAPDGKVYGSTNHPFRMFSLDAATGAVTNLGGLKRVGGGNLRGLVWHNGVVYGADYSGGRLWAYDTAKPWKDSDGADANPRNLGAYAADLGRPRTMLRHPTGDSVIWSGMAGYGYPYGGMGFYDTRSGEIAILKNDRLVPGLSCITLRALPDGNLVGGTTITAGFGHDAGVTTAEIFMMDYARRTVTFHTAPVPGATMIQCVAVGEDGMVYGLTGSGDLFVFDPSVRVVKGRVPLKEYGSVLQPDQALFRHGARLYALLGRALLEVGFRQNALHVRKVMDLDPPATAGTAVVADRMYYASDAEVWSLPLPKD